MNAYFLIILGLISILFAGAFFLLDYVKNMYQFDLLLERLFNTFLRIEKTSLNSNENFYTLLCEHLRKTFVSKGCFLFIPTEKVLMLSSFSCSDDSIQQCLKFDKNKTLSVNKSPKMNRLRYGRMPKWLSDQLLENKQLALIYPVYQNKHLVGIFLFIYKNLFTFNRARRKLFFGQKKLNHYIVDMITVIKEKQRNIHSVILETIKDFALITIDTDFNITSWNKGAEIIFGYDAGEAVNKKIVELIDDKSKEEFQKAIDASEAKSEIKTELTMRDGTGTVMLHEMVLKRMIIDGILAGYYIVFKDITKEGIWRNNINRQTMINRSIVENARDGILLLDNENHVIYFNEKLKKIADTNISYIGMDIEKIFRFMYGEKLKRKIDELKNGDLELNYINMKMQDSWYNIRFFPIKTKDQMDGVIILFVDNTYIMKAREKVETMNKNLLENLEVAKMMHLSLIPSVLPDNKEIKFTSIFLPSDEVGGDFYHVDEIEIDGRKHYLAMLADVSGHGVGASMLTVLVKDVYSDFKNSILEKDVCDLSLFLKQLNKKILNLNMEGSKFVTVAIMMLDLESRKMTYSSAGHPNSVILRHSEPMEFFGSEKAPPVGIIEEYVYHQDSLDLKPRDKICLYSDGILDLFSHDTHLFNLFLFERENKNIFEIKGAIENKVEAEMKEVRNHRIDDITIVLAELE